MDRGCIPLKTREFTCFREDLPDCWSLLQNLNTSTCKLKHIWLHPVAHPPGTSAQKQRPAGFHHQTSITCRKAPLNKGTASSYPLKSMKAYWGEELKLGFGWPRSCPQRCMVLCVDTSLEVEGLSQLKYGGDSLRTPVIWKERSPGIMNGKPACGSLLPPKETPTGTRPWVLTKTAPDPRSTGVIPAPAVPSSGSMAVSGCPAPEETLTQNLPVPHGQ